MISNLGRVAPQEFVFEQLVARIDPLSRAEAETAKKLMLGCDPCNS